MGEWADVRDLRVKAQNWYRENLQGKTIRNADTGWELRFTRAARGKMGGKGQFLLNSVPALEAIIERAEKIGEERELKGRDQIKAYHYMRAAVEIAGERRDLIVTIREMEDGRKFYDLNHDNLVGTRTKGPMDARESRVEPDVEIGADTLNIASADAEINSDPTLTPARARAINVAAWRELSRIGIGGQVRAEAGGAGEATGSYQRGVIRIIHDRGRGWRHTLNHEIIHALRDSDQWGKDYGLFTAEEWRALARAARADDAIRGRVEAAYPDLSTAAQTEEMVAELYADWAQGRRDDPPGPITRALDRIRSFFRALASALRGEGFQDAARIMERIASGEVGGRGPDGPGGIDSGQEREQRDTRLASEVSAVWNGQRPDRPVLVSRSMPSVYQALFGKDLPLMISASVIKKAGNHGLTLNDVVSALNGLSSPVMVFDSTNESSNLTALIEMAAEDGRPVVVAIDADHRVGKLEISRIATIHGKNNPDAIMSWIGSGYLRYVDKRKAGAWSRSIGRQLPKDMETSHRLGVRILQHRDVFKSDPDIKEQRDMGGLKEQLSRSKGRALGMIGSFDWRRTPEVFSNLLTDAMGKDDRFNILSLVPGNPLFEELAKGLPAAARYLDEKRQMDAWRNDWQARAAKVVDGWTRIARKNPAANDALMDLMHSTTLSGVDPTRRDSWRRPVDGEAARVLKDPLARAARKDWARKIEQQAADRRKKWDDAKAVYDALPAEFQEMYGKARDEYAAMADEQEGALMQNIRTAARIALKRARREHKRELERIRDEGLTGEERMEAIGKAHEKLTRAEARAARG
ncbi:MAG: hypothetical protein ACK5IP_19525, partial [Paracoccus sp. (in: a-proteobacteria)]